MNGNRVNSQETAKKSVQRKSVGIQATRRKMALVENVCNYIRSGPSADMSLASLERQFNVSRFAIQKAFKEIMGISPRKYVEECRILLLKKNLRKGRSVPRAIYDTGYNSQSWLYGDAEAKLGMTTASYRRGGEGAEIHFQTACCSLGILLVAETSRGICSVNIADSEERLVRALHEEYPRASVSRSDTVRKRMDAVLDYLNGQKLSLPFDVNGTDFQRSVWSAILSIPYGQTRSYDDIARMIGKPEAVRAVANACGANPVPLVIPCHRVVRKDGKIGGYGLGAEKKKFLLELEGSSEGGTASVR